MNWTQFEGQWSHVKGSLKSKWGRLTEDDLRKIAGNKNVLVGTFQERYGVLKTDAEKRLDEWLARVMPWAPYAKASAKQKKKRESEKN